MILGYARVSTDGQTLDAQQSALAAAGAGAGVCGKGLRCRDRPQSTGPRNSGAGCWGLLVTRLDRLARSRLPAKSTPRDATYVQSRQNGPFSAQDNTLKSRHISMTQSHHD
jgi:DNA invertase Pin-like site-specific DNA recombinase